MTQESHQITRFAPSPTGHLHDGHLIHLGWVLGWASANDATVVYRIEDHDQTRCREEYVQSIERDFKFLCPKGLNVKVVPRQSERAARYRSVLDGLLAQKRAYVCLCSKQDFSEKVAMKSLGCPRGCQMENHEWQLHQATVRIRVEEQETTFLDLRHGLQSVLVSGSHDPIAMDRLGQFTYFFCVIVDDVDQCVNVVIRGEDLQEQTGQQLVARRLIFPEAKDPRYLHHPLLFSPSGEKISKRFFANAFSNHIKTEQDVLNFFQHHAGLGGLRSPEYGTKMIEWNQLIPPRLVD
jgi:glutamyl-Q tRNA(Asp) synthetase